MQRGAVALAEVECNGIRIDEKYLHDAIRKTAAQIKQMESDLRENEVCKVWRKCYGRAMNMNSNAQLGRVLFDEMGFPVTDYTENGNYKTDEGALRKIDHPFIDMYFECEKLKKAKSTYLEGLAREVVNGFLHSFFNLHIARTFRSSSEAINFQNIPIRNKKMNELIRTAFIPRKGRHLVEIDFSGIEVRIAACYHKDPMMLKYIKDPTKDMHRDMAMQCYKLPQEEVTKDIRYCGKNMFVFPQFYGDYYIDCARSLWEAVARMNLQTTSEVDLYNHLRDCGITKLGDLDPDKRPKRGTFECHIKEVERSFWEDRFPVYNNWKRRWYKRYLQKGWFPTKTGFVCQGHMSRNDVINYPVQGSAFHCLLWSLIELVDELRKRRMKSLVVGQIHDSIVADVPDSELDKFIRLAYEIMTERLMDHWRWIIVPLEVEAEATDVNKPWATKKVYELN